MSFNLRLVGPGLAALAAIFGSPCADAQTTNIRNFYDGIDAGVLIPDNTSFRASTSVGGGETLSISGNVGFDTGAAVRVASSATT